MIRPDNEVTCTRIGEVGLGCEVAAGVELDTTVRRTGQGAAGQGCNIGGCKTVIPVFIAIIDSAQISCDVHFQILLPACGGGKLCRGNIRIQNHPPAEEAERTGGGEDDAAILIAHEDPHGLDARDLGRGGNDGGVINQANGQRAIASAIPGCAGTGDYRAAHREADGATGCGR